MSLTAASYHSLRLLGGTAVVATVTALLSACGGKAAAARPPTAAPAARAVEYGVASWYGRPYHGRATSSGEIYDMDQMTAAHPSLPFGSEVRVVNLENGRSVVVRINDRGPFLKRRVIDLSREAARRLEMLRPGTARVRLETAGAAAPAISGDSGVVAAGPRPSGLTACPETPFYAVQAGAFAERENAEKMLGEMGIERGGARVLPSADGRLFRVLIGDFSAPRAAQQALADVRRVVPEAFVTRIESSIAQNCPDLS